MKWLKKLLDLNVLLGIGIFFLLIGFVDVIGFTDARSITEMTWWGQTSIYLFFIIFIALVLSPVISWLRQLF